MQERVLFAVSPPARLRFSPSASNRPGGGTEASAERGGSGGAQRGRRPARTCATLSRLNAISFASMSASSVRARRRRSSHSCIAKGSCHRVGSEAKEGETQAGKCDSNATLCDKCSQALQKPLVCARCKTATYCLRDCQVHTAHTENGAVCHRLHKMHTQTRM